MCFRVDCKLPDTGIGESRLRSSEACTLLSTCSVGQEVIRLVSLVPKQSLGTINRVSSSSRFQTSSDGFRCTSCRKGTYDVKGEQCRPCPFGAECEGTDVRTVTPETFVYISVLASSGFCSSSTARFAQRSHDRLCAPPTSQETGEAALFDCPSGHCVIGGDLNSACAPKRSGTLCRFCEDTM